MIELPMLSRCGLDDAELEAQLGRYRALAPHVVDASRRRRELAVEFGAGVDRALLDEAIEIETGCCAFIAIERTGDRVRMSVADSRDDPALAAIAGALGVV